MVSKRELPFVQHVKCSHCGKEHGVRVEWQLGYGAGNEQTIKCLRCNENFDAILAGPFAGGPLALRTPWHYFSQWILISFSNGLNSTSPVTSSAILSLASAAAKASAKLILKRALKSAALSANARVVD